MPKTTDDFDRGIIVEDRKIKLGENVPTKSGGKVRPSKIEHPKITMPLKSASETNFSVDEEIMDAIRDATGLRTFKNSLNGGPKPDHLDGIPVFCMSDDISKNIFIYKGMWRKNSSLCFSLAGKDDRFGIAKRRFDTDDHKNGRRLTILDDYDEVPCDSTCHMWKDKDCKYKAVVNVQLQHRPRFPATTRYRTSGWYIIQSLLGSLRAIAEVTGGILTGIPLTLRRYEMDVIKSEDGRTQRIPIVAFDFDGEIPDLRRHAVNEMISRNKLKDAMAGSGLVMVESSNTPSFAPASFSDPKGLSNENEAEEEVVDIPSNDDLSDKEKEDNENKTRSLMEKVAKIAKDLNFSAKRFELLIDKHDEDYESMLEDLERQAFVPAGDERYQQSASDDHDWAPGVEGGESEEDQPSIKHGDENKDDTDGLPSWMSDF